MKKTYFTPIVVAKGDVARETLSGSQPVPQENSLVTKTIEAGGVGFYL